MAGSALEERAAVAFREHGEDEYWKTLSTGPRKTPTTNVNPDNSDHPESSDNRGQTDM
jgi:hypothetical protein